MSIRTSGLIFTLLTLSVATQRDAIAADARKTLPPSGARAADMSPAENPRIRVERATTEPQSADAQDAKDYPRLLPKSGQSRGWVKTEPVRVAKGAELMRLIDDERLAQIVALYPTKQAARCVYTNKQTRADVTLIEAATADDAFGILSVYSADTPHGPEGDGSFRSITHKGPAMRAAACQGVNFVVLSVDRAAEEPERQAVEALLTRIIFSAPYAEAPLLVRIIPREKLPDCRIWLVRHSEALKLVARDGAAGENAPRAWAEMDSAEMDKRLGLDGEPMLSVAAVRAGGAADVIWITEYATSAAADAAYDRYATGAKNAPTALDADTTLALPFNRFVLGSWTAEQEKGQHLLPLLRTILPEPVPAARAAASQPATEPAASAPASTTAP
jgi:hypothetical protein